MPAPLRDPQAWPFQLRRLIATWGVDEVWRRGLFTLGYPPTWAVGGSEILSVLRAFE